MDINNNLPLDTNPLTPIPNLNPVPEVPVPNLTPNLLVNVDSHQSKNTLSNINHSWRHRRK